MTRSEHPTLMLLQQVAMHEDARLHCREVSLNLSSDQQHVVLSRYNECYSPDGMHWVEHRHQVLVAELVRWLIQRGDRQGPIHSDSVQG